MELRADGKSACQHLGHHNHGAIKLRQQERVHDESTNLTNEGIKTLFHTMCGKCAGVMFGDSLEIKNEGTDKLMREFNNSQFSL